MSVERQLLMAASGVSTQYTIAKSLRFRSSASAYLNRTFGTNGTSTTTKTLSFWVKRGLSDSALHLLFGGYDGSSGNDFLVTFDVSAGFVQDGFRVSCGGTSAYDIVTSSVYRDFSAWYHFVVAFDTTQATASNRVKIYVNGNQLTAFNTANYPAQNATISFGYGNANNKIGSRYSGAVNFFDGYMAEINFIDGQALTPSSFGETSSTTGVWIPKQYSESYGTNGFYLKFTDTTSTTTLGNDSSGNGNNWTPNNLSLTTGSTYDSMLDSPTNYDNGGNGVGNYAVLNPLANSVYNTVSEANLKVTGSGSWGNTRASFGLTSGKWYWEQSITSGTWGLPGISTAQAVLDTYDYPYTIYGWSYRPDNGNKYTANTQTAYGATFGVSDIIGVAFDADAGSLTFYKNGTSQGVAFTGLTSGPYFPTVAGLSSVNVINFGQRPFAYTPPSGYKSLCTYNLPTPTIQNGAGYMAASLYTGNSSTQSIVNAVNGVSFAPDFVWLKIRSTTGQHVLSDTIRGPSVQLFSSLTNAETSEPGKGITAFNSNGFTLGNELAVTGSSNLSGATYVGWQWKAGGTAVTNTAGSITSSVSANTTSGFSVVTYTGTGANATVGHGLGVAPSMVITKCRSASGGNWPVYHVSNGATGAVWLNVPYSFTASSLFWNNTNPTSNVFSIGSSNTDTNVTGGTMVAYCFAAIPGYSAFGSYIGNSSADGPFIYLGFRPRFILVKRTDSTGSWVIWDTSRSTYNVMSDFLSPDLAGAELNLSPVSIDVVSNGFKVRGNATSINTGTMIYACFAENPFQNARAR